MLSAETVGEDYYNVQLKEGAMAYLCMLSFSLWGVIDPIWIEVSEGNFVYWLVLQSSFGNRCIFSYI